MFSNSIEGLSTLETGIASELGQFAETSKQYAGSIKDMVCNEVIMVCLIL
jgi:hypothetical protein